MLVVASAPPSRPLAPYAAAAAPSGLGAAAGSRRSTSFFHQHASSALFRFQFLRIVQKNAAHQQHRCCDVCGVRAHDAAASCGQRRPLSRTPRERGLCARRGTGLPAEGGAAGERRAGSVPSSWGALETPRGRARWLGTDRCRVLSSLRNRFVCDEISSNLTARPGRNFAARNLYDNEPTCGLPSLKKNSP